MEPDDWPEPSCAQERLCLMEQVRPGELSQRTQLVVELTGPLDTANLRRALDIVVNRHEMLRVGFRAEDGRLRQCVEDRVRIELALEDWENPPHPPSREAIEHWVANAIRQPLDLETAPVLRVALLRLRVQEHVLVLVSHRAVADSASMRVLFDDLAVSYREFVLGNEPVFPEPPVRPVQDTAPHQSAPWLSQLADANCAVVPPADRAPAAGPVTERGRRRISLDHDVMPRLAWLADETTAIPLAAFVQLLARYTGEYDLTVALPVRPDGLESTVGPFENTMVLRVDLTDNPTFRQLVRRTHELVSAAQSRGGVPVEVLLTKLRPADYLDCGPLAKAGFEAGADLPASAECAGLRMTVLDLAVANSEFPLALRFWLAGRKLVVEARYDADRFSTGFVDAFLDTYRILLRRNAENPNVRVQDVRLDAGPDHTGSSAATRKQRTRRYPLITELIDQVSALDPGAPMLVSGDRSWSYRELQDRAGQIADKLLSIGHGAGETVAICTTARCFELYASLLGVWRAGGVVALVNAARPAHECLTMLDSARARTMLVLGDEPPGWWPTAAAENVLVLSAENGLSTLRHGRGSVNAFSEDSPAYIFFTSGTTGMPKALLGSHNSLSHFVLWQQREFGFQPGDRCAQLTSLFTDGVLRDIFTPLISGCSLHVPADPGLRPADAAILGWLKKSAVTSAHTMPSLSARWLGDTEGVGTLEDLRLLFFSGEPLTGALTKRWHDLAPRAQLVNLYGTSECTMIQASHRVVRDAYERIHPAGRAMHGTDIFVLTPSETPCGRGEVGQVHIRTPYATLGYVGKNESAFFANPFRDDPDDRFFRTGDQARIRLDGELEVFGRSSDGVRIGGGKVNPEQVNALLARQAGVRASAVVRITRADNSPRLVAFVVLDGPQATDPAALRRELRKRLSPADIPAHIMAVPELPVTDVGKLDRAALRRRFADHSASNSTGPAEEAVAAAWSAVLEIEDIDLDAHFFDLGGSPREAVEIATKLRAELAIPLDLDAVFATPVFSELAQTVHTLKSLTQKGILL